MGVIIIDEIDVKGIGNIRHLPPVLLKYCQTYMHFMMDLQKTFDYQFLTD